MQQPKGRRALSIKCFMERAAEANTSSVVSLERSAVIKLALFETHRRACLSLGLYGRALMQSADGAVWPHRSSFGGTPMFPGLNLAKASFTCKSRATSEQG